MEDGLKTGASLLGSAVPTHTPGPWRVERMHSGFFHIMDSRHRNVVTAYGGGVEIEAGESNARLIAAAPDLLEAANRALRGDGYEYTLPESVRSVLRAAIAEAEGQA